MSAPVSRDPLVVNTQDGACWTRRAVTREGRGLYALAEVSQDVPDMVLASLADLAEHGLASMADALPMPVGPEPSDEVFVPRTERSYWEDIAAALNAAHSVGMPVGVDLDGTLTDRNAWSVVWDRVTERWTVAGYEEEADEPYVSRLLPPSDARCGCGHSGAEHHHAGARCWARLPRELGEPVRLCVCEGFAPVSVTESADRLARFIAPAEDPHDGPLHHSYLVSRDLPETGGVS